MTTNAPRTPPAKAPSANTSETPPASPSGRPRWSATEAAKRCGVGRATILRALADGRITGAEQHEQGWSIPLEGLLVAGFKVDRPTPDHSPVHGHVQNAPVVPDHRDQTIQELRAELALERVHRAAAVTLADSHYAHLQTALRVLNGPPQPVDPDEPPIPAPAPVGNLVASPAAPVAKARRWPWHRQP